MVKTSDETLLSVKHEKQNHYRFKLSKEFKARMAGMNSICCCICAKGSKQHKYLYEILEKGEAKLQKYINAEYIFETLREHQKILKQLQPEQVLEKVYDDVINLSDQETGGNKLEMGSIKTVKQTVNV